MARRTVLAGAPFDRSVRPRTARAIAVLSTALALSTGGAVAASAATTATVSTASASTTSASTTSTTPTTAPPTAPPTSVPPTSAPPTTEAPLPPPPAFPLGDDFGRLLLLHRRDAVAMLATATTDVATSNQLVDLAAEHVHVARAAQVEARAYARAVSLKLISIQQQIKALAVDAYIMGSSPQFSGALASFASARSVVDLSRNLTFVHSSNDRLSELIDLEHRDQTRAAAQVSATTSALTNAVDDSRTAAAGLADAQQRRATAIADIQQSARDQTQFFADATTSASPIMGPSRLTADELVAYITSLGLHPKLTVPLRTLAGWYISEGNAEGVRGDVAFAQSILETGAFMFPGHGLLDPGDNNYAGIDACDSCKHGDRFGSALLGVRAQIQLLRIYADPSLTKITDLAHPLALLHQPRLGFSGQVQTWYALGGRWATGANYGFHIYAIYQNMVALAGLR
jgi:hypothetical protein